MAQMPMMPGQIKVVRKQHDIPSSSQSIPSNTGYFATFDVNTEIGYIPIGIVGIERYGTGSNFAVPSKFYINNSYQAYVQIENEGSNTATVTAIFVDVLYIKR